MKRLLACASAAAIAAAMPAAAGEAPYTGPGSDPAALGAERACGPQINEAARILVYVPQSDPRRSEIVRELQYARSAMRDGRTDECLSEVRRAREIEDAAADPDPDAGGPYGRRYTPYAPPVPYGVPAPGYPGSYPGYGPYGGYGGGYGAPAPGDAAPW